VLWGETRDQQRDITMAYRAVLVSRPGIIGVQLGGEGRADAGGCVGGDCKEPADKKARATAGLIVEGA
jgi:hypothetical protein